LKPKAYHSARFGGRLIAALPLKLSRNKSRKKTLAAVALDFCDYRTTLKGGF
jgi:hypothetical protein